MRVCVKVEGCDKYAVIDTPEYDSPTYNLTKMFRACMGWDFEQGEYYPASFVIEKIKHGITELITKPEEYHKYDPPNGWGTLEGALKSLQSAYECIYECAEEYPIECLYFRW